MSISLLDLKNLVIQRCDMGNGFNSSALPGFINAAYLRLYDEIIATYQDYKLQHFDFTISGNEDGYTIPSSIRMYKFRGLDYNTGSNQPVTVRSFEWQERNQFNVIPMDLIPYLDQAPVMYDYVGDKILLKPQGCAAGNYRCYYIPDLIFLVNDSDTIFPELEKWFHYIVVAASISLLDSEESDTGALQRELAMWERSIKGLAANRDANAGKKIADTRSRNNLGIYFRQYP